MHVTKRVFCCILLDNKCGSFWSWGSEGVLPNLKYVSSSSNSKFTFVFEQQMRKMISRNCVFSLYILLMFTGSFFSNVSATRPSKIVSGILSNVVSALFKWMWSLKPTAKIGFVIPNRSMMKFEDGYTVETVFDGSKLGIEPYSVEVTPTGELLVLDSQNSNIHKVSTGFSRYRLPKLVAGSSEGYSGHVDGKPREARLNHPKGLTVDDRGNIYVADTKNMAIRKISDTGVVTIAGGNWVRGSGHIDGPSDSVKFSNDFDVQYVASSCSILVVDRGNQAIREIQLHDDDCSFHHYDGIAVLSAAMFCGFMLALLQRRISAMLSSPHDPRPPLQGVHPSTYQKPVKSVRPPLIPPEVDEQEKEEDGFFDSLGKLFINTGSSLFEIFSGLFSSSKKKPINTHHTNHHQFPPYFNTWPMQETFVIPNRDPPLSLETRNPNSRKSYPEKPRHSNQSRYIYGKHSGKHLHQQQQMQQLQQHHQMHYSLGPQTYYQENNETTNEVVFGAVQEQDRNREDMFIKAVDYRNPSYSFQNLRSRYNYMGYAYDMY
ncbi:hypothetical protein L6452_44581 [Arctium lappa]|uniref:Uncharacterized protein n=1 Tax=Arctium lappa TaxID=4217 RepID=A0ACB8XGA1_ARCLA|nr:hypothetical protein L6452_44581 [Arctium lappa]